VFATVILQFVVSCKESCWRLFRESLVERSLINWKCYHSVNKIGSIARSSRCPDSSLVQGDSLAVSPPATPAVSRFVALAQALYGDRVTFPIKISFVPHRPFYGCDVLCVFGSFIQPFSFHVRESRDIRNACVKTYLACYVVIFTKISFGFRFCILSMFIPMCCSHSVIHRTHMGTLGAWKEVTTGKASPRYIFICAERILVMRVCVLPQCTHTCFSRFLIGTGIGYCVY
jgi:hypothetical protein